MGCGGNVGRGKKGDYANTALPTMDVGQVKHAPAVRDKY